jgi:SanA protein
MKIEIEKIKKMIKKLILPSAIIVLGVVLFIVYCNYVIMAYSQYCYSDINKLPEIETALVLGAAQKNKFGNPNLYFLGRVETAAKLFHAGKIKHILISGDNGRIDYDEPTAMRNALMERGVPENAMTRDYAGFSTLDSVVRAKNVFGKDKYLVITQIKHAERAVYLARKHGIEATAFYATEPSEHRWLVQRNRRREILARVSAWLDINILCKKPKFEK